MSPVRPSRRKLAHDVQWFQPGELVFALELPDETTPSAVHRRVRTTVQTGLAGRAGGVFRGEQSREEPIIFTAPDRPPLAFYFYDLEDQSTALNVNRVLGELRVGRGAASLDEVRAQGALPQGAMPHWMALAQQDCIGGSPGSVPRGVARSELPAREGPWEYVYRPTQAALDLRDRVSRLPRRALVPVVVLDSAPDAGQAARAARRHRDLNAQLAAVASLVEAPDEPVARRFGRVSGLRLLPPLASVEPYDLSDHGLFVASLVHSVAPRAALRLLPVLAPSGIGDLETLLRGLARALADKQPGAPLIINLSLGLLPALERLPFIWYGQEPPTDAGYAGALATGGDALWMRGHDTEVQATTRSLHAALDLLSEYLLANNCLVVAAAGNDSLERVEDGLSHLGPRVPARYFSALGVGATAPDAAKGASYSNTGDTWGFDVATFGGEVDVDGNPLDGVIGVYTDREFPLAKTGRRTRSLPNETGWARWSGTSFATGLVSGMVANLWATRRDRREVSASEMLSELARQADGFAADLSMRSIAMRGSWERV